jgi:hypothetical protein
MTEFYTGDRVLPRKPPYYRTGEECSVWFTPELVWEIRGAGKCSSQLFRPAKIRQGIFWAVGMSK